MCYELLTKGAEVTYSNSSNISAYKAAIMNNSMNGKQLYSLTKKLLYKSNLLILDLFFAAKAVIENHLIPQIINMPTDEL